MRKNTMPKLLQTAPKKQKLSALEKVLLKKMKQSAKSGWMLDAVYNR